MKRRKFIQSTVAASTLPLAYASAHNSSNPESNSEKELYEIRIYEMRFRGNFNLLRDYLLNALAPALNRLGNCSLMPFVELGNSDPRKLWVIFRYASMEHYLEAQNLDKDEQFVKDAQDYNAITEDQTIFNRYTSFLLHAFDGMPQMMKPIEGASLFELRTYEGYSEDAVRRKIKMFDVEEIELFHKTKLYPVFFGKMIIGPHCPSLAYMLNFKDMEERNANWKQFLEHPEWNAMKAKKEYANTISNIRKVFLKPL